MVGTKMLSASLVLENPPIVMHGFKTINVQALESNTFRNDCQLSWSAAQVVETYLELIAILIIVLMSL